MNKYSSVFAIKSDTFPNAGSSVKKFLRGRRVLGYWSRGLNCTLTLSRTHGWNKSKGRTVVIAFEGKSERKVEMRKNVDLWEQHNKTTARILGPQLEYVEDWSEITGNAWMKSLDFAREELRAIEDFWIRKSDNGVPLRKCAWKGRMSGLV